MGSFVEPERKDEVVVLVTGTNSGLGLAICCRLIDEFLATRPDTQSLVLIFTTRSSKKSNETLAHLQRHLHRSSASTASKSRVTLRPEHVDLCDLLSVRALSRRLLSSLPKLDVLVLNAGFAGFTGLNWFRAVFFILTDLVHAVTWPSVYTRSDTGVLVKKQTSLPDEPPLGQIFCANVFGHYMLSHNLMPLLKVSTDPPGRIIWTSSLEATPAAFNIDDIQALQIARPYESAKYLTDLLALTSSLPSTAPNVSSFLSPSSPTSKIKSGPDSNTLLSTEPAQNQTEMPKIYATHPGICATSIVPLILPLHYCMMAAFFLARMLGSPWHVISSYTGACSTIWLSLAPQSVLDAAEAAYTRMGGGGKVKWGSSCDRLGRERVVCTEVEGWGFGGVVGPPVTEEDKRRRRKRGMRDLTTEERVEFEELGRKSWREMEELRVQWEELLSRAEAQKEASSS